MESNCYPSTAKCAAEAFPQYYTHTVPVGDGDSCTCPGQPVPMLVKPLGGSSGGLETL